MLKSWRWAGVTALIYVMVTCGASMKITHEPQDDDIGYIKDRLDLLGKFRAERRTLEEDPSELIHQLNPARDIDLSNGENPSKNNIWDFLRNDEEFPNNQGSLHDANFPMAELGIPPSALADPTLVRRLQLQDLQEDYLNNNNNNNNNNDDDDDASTDTVTDADAFSSSSSDVLQKRSERGQALTPPARVHALLKKLSDRKRYNFGRPSNYARCDMTRLTRTMILSFLHTGRMCGQRVSRFRFGLSG